ncbi:hypothetical protein BH11ACT4_BH11ACT4_10800 [soil metagenome]
MTSTLAQARPAASGMSVADCNFDTKEEVHTMTATTAVPQGYAANTMAERGFPVRRPRPRGIDRVVMRLSLAMLLWARHRADRGVVTHEEHTLRRATALAVERDRRDAAARISRVF